MRERETNESYLANLNILSKINSPDLREKHLAKSVVLRMSERRGRISDNDDDTLKDRLLNEDVFKPGELIEFHRELNDSKHLFTSKLASEVADIAYYAIQIKNEVISKLFWTHLLAYSIDKDEAVTLAILKYETRLAHGDKNTYKDIENDILEKHLIANGRINTPIEMQINRLI